VIGDQLCVSDTVSTDLKLFWVVGFFRTSSSRPSAEFLPRRNAATGILRFITVIPFCATMKFYLYISDAKIDMLLPQIAHEAKKKIATEFGFDLKIFKPASRLNSSATR
jgi:hypothetical protein